MCVIFGVSDSDKVKDFKNNIKLAEEWNKDGNSFSFFDGKKIKFFKAISNAEVLDLIEKYNLKEFVYHARITSSGKTVDSLTHAFPLDLRLLNSNKMQGETKAVYYMNGTLDFEDLAKIYLDYCIKNDKKIINGELSDSKLIAILISIYGYNFINLFDSRHSARHIIHDSKGIHYFGNWSEYDNMQVSNKNFIPIENKWVSGYQEKYSKQSNFKDGNFSISNEEDYFLSSELDNEFEDFEDYLKELTYIQYTVKTFSKFIFVALKRKISTITL